MARQAACILALIAGVLPATSVGGTRATDVVVRGDAEQCRVATVVQLWSVSRGEPVDEFGTLEVRQTYILGPAYPPIQIVLKLITEQAVGNQCAWVFKALPRGAYVVAIRRKEGSAGSAEFVVDETPSREIQVAAPLVTVTGRAVINGLPAAGKAVGATSSQFPRPSVAVITDRDGRYTLIVDQAGPYEIKVVDVATTTTSLVNGPNLVDFSVGRP